MVVSVPDPNQSQCRSISVQMFADHLLHARTKDLNEITGVHMTLIQNTCAWHRLNKAHSIGSSLWLVIALSMLSGQNCFVTFAQTP